MLCGTSRTGLETAAVFHVNNLASVPHHSLTSTLDSMFPLTPQISRLTLHSFIPLLHRSCTTLNCTSGRTGVRTFIVNQLQMAVMPGLPGVTVHIVYQQKAPLDQCINEEGDEQLPTKALHKDRVLC